MKEFRGVLIEVYLDYRNNYLTIEKWAEHNGLNRTQGETVLWVAREVFESMHPEA